MPKRGSFHPVSTINGPESASVPGRGRSWFLAGTLGILSLAAVVRVSTLGVQDFWLDELHALLNSAAHRGPFEALPNGEFLRDIPRYTDLGDDSTAARVWRGMRDDSHPPVFFVLLYAWRCLFGDGEFIVRLPAAIFSVLSILPVALILREYGRPRAGLGAALLLCFAFAHIHMGQQARPYSLSMFLVGTGYWLLILMDRRWGAFGTRARVLCAATYAFTLGLAMLTHYFAGLGLLGHVVYALLRFRRALLATWAVSVAVGAAAFAIVWLPGLLAQVDFIKGQDWVRETADDPVWRCTVRAADLPLRLLFPTPLHRSSSRVAFTALAGFLVLIAALAVVWRARDRAALVFTLWYAVPVVAFVGLDLFGERQLLAHLRYTSIAVPGWAGLIVIAAARLRLRRPVLLLSAGMLAVTFALTIKLPATENPEARQVARTLQDRVGREDVLVFDAIGWIPCWGRHEFLLVWHYLPHADYPILLLNEPPRKEVLERLRSHERIFLVSPRIDAVPNPTPETHRVVERTQYVRALGRVYLFTRADASPPTPE